MVSFPSSGDTDRSEDHIIVGTGHSLHITILLTLIMLNIFLFTTLLPNTAPVCVKACDYKLSGNTVDPDQMASSEAR